MNYPRHVAIIPDGNRTWAKREGKSIKEGYITSYQKGMEIMKYIFTQTPIEVFTLRGLSTENAKKRSPEEINLLMNLYKIINDEEMIEFLKQKKINFHWFGNADLITADFREYLDNLSKEHTYLESNKHFVILVAYGGRDEIIRGIRKMAKDNYNFKSITEEDLSKNLDFGKLPNIDLVIRTKGNLAQRTSGFMSWWIGYAELYFTSKLCPEFEVEDFKQALQWFDKVVDFRNFGK